LPFDNGLGVAACHKEKTTMEITQQEELKAHLMATSEEFRNLVRQHAEYDRRIETLETTNRLSEEEQMEEVRLKKLKLHLKDQITDWLGRYRLQNVA
jgi:uncharacterized protein YdcH (DUF465 family)